MSRKEPGFLVFVAFHIEKKCLDIFIWIVNPLVKRIQKVEQNGTLAGLSQQEQLSQFMRSSEDSNTPSGPTANQNLETRFDDLEARADGVDLLMAELEARIDSVKAEREEVAVKFAGVGVGSIDELGPWIKKHFSERAFGLIMDPYLLLHLIVGKDSNQKMLLDAMKQCKDLNINTEANAKALVALLHEVPEMMHSCTADEVGASDHASYLSQLKMYDQWGTGARCMKKFNEKRLVQTKTLVMNRICKDFDFGSVGYQVAIEALEKSVTWLGNLVSFIDRTFKSVHLNSKYTKWQAWALTTQLVRRVRNDLYSVCLGALDNMEGDQHSMCKAVLWAVFCTYNLMETYKVAHFVDNYPSISLEYVKFLATNSGFEQMEAVQKEMASLVHQNKELSQALEKHKKAANQAASTAGKAKKLANDMVKKFVALERREVKGRGGSGRSSEDNE